MNRADAEELVAHLVGLAAQGLPQERVRLAGVAWCQERLLEVPQPLLVEGRDCTVVAAAKSVARAASEAVEAARVLAAAQARDAAAKSALEASEAVRGRLVASLEA